jgi:DNA-binding MarR family transcriptional regulator
MSRKAVAKPQSAALKRAAKPSAVPRGQSVAPKVTPPRASSRTVAQAPDARALASRTAAPATRTKARASGSPTGATQAAVPSALAVQSWLSVVRAYNLCTATLTERLASLNLSLAEHEVLVNLLRLPGLTQQQLAERCFVAKSGISMLVTRMEGAGWVVRTPSEVDARARLLHLTSDGFALAEAAYTIQGEVVTAMTGRFSDEELRFVDTAMTHVASALEAMKRA